MSKAGDGIRTHDVQLGNAAVGGAQAKPGNDLRHSGGALTHRLHADPDLAKLLDAWPALAEPIRRAIMALIESAR